MKKRQSSTINSQHRRKKKRKTSTPNSFTPVLITHPPYTKKAHHPIHQTKKQTPRPASINSQSRAARNSNPPSKPQTSHNRRAVKKEKKNRSSAITLAKAKGRRGSCALALIKVSLKDARGTREKGRGRGTVLCRVGNKRYVLRARGSLSCYARGFIASALSLSSRVAVLSRAEGKIELDLVPR